MNPSSPTIYYGGRQWRWTMVASEGEAFEILNLLGWWAARSDLKTFVGLGMWGAMRVSAFSISCFSVSHILIPVRPQNLGRTVN